MTDSLLDPVRLEAVHASQLLERSPYALRELTWRAVRDLSADLAQVNVLTDTLQHTVAQWPEGEMIDHPVSTSGCIYVVRAGATVAVNDTACHDEICKLPWAPFTRGYLGTPIRYRGQVLGSFCVLTIEPRQWSEQDRQLLEGLASTAARSIDGAP